MSRKPLGMTVWGFEENSETHKSLVWNRVVGLRLRIAENHLDFASIIISRDDNYHAIIYNILFLLLRQYWTMCFYILHLLFKTSNSPMK